jgi:hypothetical protein
MKDHVYISPRLRASHEAWQYNIAFPSDKKGRAPTLKPGDIVMSDGNDIGVIVGAEVVIDGGRYFWTSKNIPEAFETGNMPQYSVEWENTDLRHSWWQRSEFTLIGLGPFHYDAWWKTLLPVGHD